MKWGVWCSAAEAAVRGIGPRYTAATREKARALAIIAARECCSKGSRHPVRRIVTRNEEPNK